MEPVTITSVPLGPLLGARVSSRGVTVNLAAAVESRPSDPLIETFKVATEGVATAGIVIVSEPGNSPVLVVNRPVIVTEPKAGFMEAVF